MSESKSELNLTPRLPAGQKVCRTVFDLYRAIEHLPPTMSLDCGQGYLPVIVPDALAPGDGVTLRLDDEFARDDGDLLTGIRGIK